MKEANAFFPLLKQHTVSTKSGLSYIYCKLTLRMRYYFSVFMWLFCEEQNCDIIRWVRQIVSFLSWQFPNPCQLAEPHSNIVSLLVSFNIK